MGGTSPVMGDRFARQQYAISRKPHSVQGKTAQGGPLPDPGVLGYISWYDAGFWGPITVTGFTFVRQRLTRPSRTR